MFGILTKKGKVPFISLDEFLDIDKMKYFNGYIHRQLHNEFLKQKNPPKYLIPFIEDKDFHSVFSTYYHDLPIEKNWLLINKYLIEVVDYLRETIMEDIKGMFVLEEKAEYSTDFHRDWGEDTTGDKHES